ncbi:MAG: S-layer homology domain-containing protein [Candidatus Margulisiibacteriota bacterium]
MLAMAKYQRFLGLMVLFCALSSLSIPAQASEIKILSFKDQTIVSADLLSLKGKAKGLSGMNVNNRSISVSKDGAFDCVLVLKNGKNLIRITAKDNNGKKQSVTLRVLRIAAFTDAKRFWDKTMINRMATLGYIEGYPDNSFNPDNPVTRGELATWLARVNGLATAKLKKDPFLDVPKEHWRAPYIVATVNKGYMSKMPGNVFGVDEPISRAEAAKIALKAGGLKVAQEVNRSLFNDVLWGTKDSREISLAKKQGLVVGISKIVPLFDPDRYITRAEGAILLSRFSNVKKGIDYLLDFSKGYNDSVLARVDAYPSIDSFTITPASINVKDKALLLLRAKIAPREGYYPISKVRVDLSALGGDEDIEMFDNGTNGDEKAGDLIYSLNLAVGNLLAGEKKATATVMDTLGLEKSKTTSLWVVE